MDAWRSCPSRHHAVGRTLSARRTRACAFAVQQIGLAVTLPCGLRPSRCREPEFPSLEAEAVPLQSRSSLHTLADIRTHVPMNFSSVGCVVFRWSCAGESATYG